MALDDATKHNKVDYHVVYDEFYYQASSWSYPRRVIVKVEKPLNQFTYQYAFIITNMELMPYQVIQFYCNRRKMENFIKEYKNSFYFDSINSQKCWIFDIQTLQWLPLQFHNYISSLYFISFNFNIKFQFYTLLPFHTLP